MNLKYFSPKIFRGVIENFKIKPRFNFFKQGVSALKLNLKDVDIFKYHILQSDYKYKHKILILC